MKYTKMFISRAIEGGWENSPQFKFRCLSKNGRTATFDVKGYFKTTHYNVAEILLDPKSFEAVGKVMGWREEGDYCESGDGCVPNDGAMHEGMCKWRFYEAEYKEKMNGLTPALNEEKSIEQYLETLFKK